MREPTLFNSNHIHSLHKWLLHEEEEEEEDVVVVE
jgi:hypothetical protein